MSRRNPSRVKVDPGAFRALVGQITRVRVRLLCTEGRRLRWKTTHTLAITPEDRLAWLLAIEAPERPFACACMGSIQLDLVQGRRTLSTVTVHHGQSVRETDWNSHALLRRGLALARWLHGHGASELLAEMDSHVARDLAVSRRRAQWLEAMPAVLESHLDALEAEAQGATASPPSAPRAIRALRASIGGAEAVVSALLRWYGSASGPWTSAPTYERVPAALLDGYGTDALIKAAARSRDVRVLLGAARLLTVQWTVTRPSEARAALGALRTRLREAVRSTLVEGNYQRLEALLRTPEPPSSARRIGAPRHPPLRSATVDAVGALALAVDGGALVAFRAGQTEPVEVFSAPHIRCFSLGEDGSIALSTAVGQGGEVWAGHAQGGEWTRVAKTPTLADAAVRWPEGIAWVEWFAAPGGLRRVMLKRGRAAPTVVTTSGLISFLQTDGRWLYWLQHTEARGYELWRAGCATGRAQRVCTLDPEGSGVTYDAGLTLREGSLWWICSDKRSVWRVSAQGGVPERVVVSKRRIHAIAVWRGALYATLEDAIDTRWWGEFTVCRMVARRAPEALCRIRCHHLDAEHLWATERGLVWVADGGLWALDWSPAQA